MKDVAALLRGIQHDDSIEARKAGGGATEAGAGARKWTDPKQPISPTKLMALAQPSQARTSSGSQSLLKNPE
jgi:hypothetical protein